MTTTYSTAYQSAAAHHALAPLGAGWGPASDDELRALRDAACAYDATGCDMPEGGLTPAQEWAIEFASWIAQ